MSGILVTWYVVYVRAGKTRISMARYSHEDSAKAHVERLKGLGKDAYIVESYNWEEGPCQT